MFDVTPEDIQSLNDADLRQLVARICEAELVSHRHSPLAVTYGGNQDASDGGLDVRVRLEEPANLTGFVPRPHTGFQVKKPDLAPRDIGPEMRPAGTLRPSIKELARNSGAYIIVSSTGSVADSALERRRIAIRAALKGVRGAKGLHVDFYDRTRIATAVRQYPGLVAWVRERHQRSMRNWRGYGSWSSGESESGNYLTDEGVKLHFSEQEDRSTSVVEGINKIRGLLRKPQSSVRLVGLSGVGKTRLAQALFDTRMAKVGYPRISQSIAIQGEAPNRSQLACCRT